MTQVLDEFYNFYSSENLAVNRPVAQSTHYTDEWAAEMAIDGVPATCTHTSPGKPNPWWTIDFGRYVYVKNISILNRSNGDPAICE